MKDENGVSIKVNNFIRHQAKKVMLEVASCYEAGDTRKVRTLWETYSQQGVIGPVMYAIVSHNDADPQLLQDIHGEVHMLTHANMTEVVDVRRKLENTHKLLSSERLALAEKNGRIKELASNQKKETQEKIRIQGENARLRRQVQALEKRIKPDTSVQAYGEKINALEQALAEANEKLGQADRERKQLQINLFSVQNENELIRKELQELAASFGTGNIENKDLGEPPDCPAQDFCQGDACPNYRLCAKRVFMIGGITKMKSYYRDIVEKAGGQFDYHDGYLKNSKADLAAKVKRCDVVVCPVNCNSHNACLRVKKLCNRYNKELKILNNASLSAVTQALMTSEAKPVH
jgi:small-conductance mechanosensitive channel